MTSVARELSRTDPAALWEEARRDVTAAFAEVFGFGEVEVANSFPGATLLHSTSPNSI
jgi:hypothetical protein